MQLSAFKTYRVKNIVFCTIKYILICLNQILLQICAIIYFLYNVYFMKLIPFLHIFSHILHILSASEATRVKISVFHTTKTILNRIDQIPLGICEMIGYQLLYFQIRAVFMKFRPFLNIFSYIFHIFSASEAPGVKV